MNVPTTFRRLTGACFLLLAALLLTSAAPASAEQVLAQFTYLDFEDNSVQPINDAKIEIWRYAPRTFGIWSWGMDRRVWTDGEGRIDVQMPWAGSGVVYELRVYAANANVTVWPQDSPHIGESWHRLTPQQTVHSSSAVLDFTQHFDDIASARSFNIARAAWFAGEYIKQVYTDLPTVSAQTTDIFSTFYDPVGDTLQINLTRAFNDFTIAHEYGHFVEEQIGTLPWRPTVHFLCDAHDAGLAWMEGFAHYYAFAVARAFPGTMKGGIGRSIEIDSASCSGTPRDAVEFWVAATLWDLTDTSTDAGSFSEVHDWTGNNDWLILSIVDHELQISDPTIWNFYDAWAGRGQWMPDIDRIFAKHDLLDEFNLSGFVSQSVPATMVAGRPYNVVVTMWNTGSTTWSAANGYRLGSQSPQDNLTWGLHRVDVPGQVIPGQQVNFYFTVTAPATPGIYTFQWKMVQDNVEWFGADAPTVQVSVTAGLQSAQFVSQSVPGTMNAGQSYPASVTMRNTGETTWTPGNYFLGSQNPADNSVWGLNRVALSAPVPPGGQVTFNFNINPPAFSGDYAFQWRMIQNGPGWFGDATPNLFLSVTAPPPVCSLSKCVSDCQLSGCRGGKCNAGECICLRCL